MSIRSHFLEEEFELIYLPNQIDIINYEQIESFEEENIQIRYSKGILSIRGKNLIITKLLEDEVFITGEVLKIEFR